MPSAGPASPGFIVRHRILLAFLWLSIPAIAVLGLTQGVTVAVVASIALALIAIATLATIADGGARSSGVVALALVVMTSVTILFFDASPQSQIIMAGAIAATSLYDAWRPLALAMAGVTLFYLAGPILLDGVAGDRLATSIPSLLALLGLGALLLIGQALERQTMSVGFDQPYRLSFRTAPMGMAILKPTGEFVEVNEALANMLSLAPEQLIGTNIDNFVHTDDLTEIGDAWERMGNDPGGTTSAWVHCVGASGSAIWCQVTMTLAPWQKHRPAMVTMQIEESGRSRRDIMNLHETIGARDAYVSAIATEVAESLESVMSKIDTMELPHADVDSLNREMRSKIKDIASILDDLRVSASAAESGTGLVPQNVDLLKVCAELTDEFDREIPIEATAKSCWSDPRPTRQIIRGLISNAIHFGGPEVRVRIKGSGPDTLVQVIDDGPEIPTSERERIFAGDIRAGLPVTRPPSIGQRLTIARRLAEQMDGEVTYERSGYGRNIYELRLPTESISVSYDLTEVSLNPA